MNFIKKLLKWLLYTIFILIACFGIGLSGGVPIPQQAKRDDNKEKIELLDDDQQTEDANNELM